MGPTSNGGKGREGKGEGKGQKGKTIGKGERRMKEGKGEGGGYVLALADGCPWD